MNIFVIINFFFNCNVSNIININLLVTFYVYFQICLIRINEINQGFLFNEIFSKLLLEEQKQLQQLFLIMISVFVVNELNTNSNVCCKDYCKQRNINCARTYSAKVILASLTSSTVSVHYSTSLSTSFFCIITIFIVYIFSILDCSLKQILMNLQMLKSIKMLVL